MSSFGENYKKNDLLDDIQHYFSEGGTIEEMFDVLRYIFEYGKTPLDDLIQENQELKKQLEEKENHQKEFIEYLVNEIKEHEKHDKKNNCEWQGYNFYQDVLSKHKEIIGDKDE